MSHKLKLQTSTESGETGIDTIQHLYDSGSGFSSKSNIKFTSGGNISFNTPSNNNTLVVSDAGNVGIGKVPEEGVKLDVNGSARIENLSVQSMTATSDRRKKTNIQPLQQYDIEKLRPVQYQWKRNPEGKTIYGFIAQEVETAYPNITKKDNAGFYSLDYIQLIPISIKNLQIQDNILKDLKDDINNLRCQLQELKNVVAINKIDNTVKI